MQCCARTGINFVFVVVGLYVSVRVPPSSGTPRVLRVVTVLLSSTLYDVPFSHNTKRYRQTDDRQTDRTSYHKRDRTTQYGRPKCKKINKLIHTAWLSESMSKDLPEARHSTAIRAPARILLVPRPASHIAVKYSYQSMHIHTKQLIPLTHTSAPS